jgi:DNA-binding beta-propeller fold protein YncE
VSEKRVACASCKKPILDGAKKCRHCKAWQPDRGGGARFPRAALIVATAVSSVFSVILTSRESPVGSAPPLTPLPTDSAVAGEPAPAAVGPDPEKPKAPAPPPSPKRKWAARELKMGDVHPLDVVFSSAGDTLYVSADDATLREYKLTNGEMLHKASLPAKGDRIRRLFDRYVAVLHVDPTTWRIPVMDVTKWDHDPTLLDVGAGPGDIEELPDGSVVTSTTVGHRVSRFSLPSGKLLADITLPQSTGQLFLVRAEGRPYLAAMGALVRGERPSGAWVDLFDPEEAPFGATRRSIAVGRDPRAGAVTQDGGAIFFPDRLSNSVSLLGVARETEAKTADVGSDPIAGFVMDGDRYGVTLNAGASTATLVTLPSMQVSTLMLPGVPRNGLTTPDRSTLFVTLGGTDEPPHGQGVAIITGDPPEVVSTLPTGQGAIAVAVSKDGARAAVANYFSKSITILE